LGEPGEEEDKMDLRLTGKLALATAGAALRVDGGVVKSAL
jgi:hypothetical protein